MGRGGRRRGGAGRDDRMRTMGRNRNEKVDKGR